MQLYTYIYFYSHQNKNKWAKIPKDQIEEAIIANDSIDCFATIQQFKEDDDILHVAPLYFDFDDAKDVEYPRQDCVTVLNFLQQELKIPDKAISCFFSGSKGFHLLVDYRYLSVEPSVYLTSFYKYTVNFILAKLKLEGLELPTLDKSVYTKKRMLRLPNTIHSKTNLHKIYLSLDEIKNLSIAEIKKLAVKPRELPPIPRKCVASIAATTFFDNRLTEFSLLETNNVSGDNHQEFKFSVDGSKPACVKYLLANKWAEGCRNKITVQLAAFYKQAGYDIESCNKEIAAWISEFSADNSKTLKRLSNSYSVISSVYEDSNAYPFACRFVRSAAPSVPCTGNLCSFIRSNDDDDDDDDDDGDADDSTDAKNIVNKKSIPHLELAATSNSEYVNQLVSTNVMLAGKKSTPYIIPKKVVYSCYSAEKCKNTGCPLMAVPSHTLEKTLSSKDRALIEMCGVTDVNKKLTLMELSGIYNCTKFNVEVLESVNIDEALVIPKAEDSKEYVLRKIYISGTNKLTANSYYNLEGYVYPHPKTQESTLMVKKATPLQDAVAAFELTDDVSAGLDTFRCSSPDSIEAIEAKIEEILDNLTSITGIVKREDVLLGVILVYCSALNLTVPWDSQEIRGWLETVIVGDTGTGKSAMLEKLMDAINLGSRVNAESTSRTGLSYKMEQSASGAWYIVWGAWPLADKSLIWVDEAFSLSKEELGQMTLARSSGKLEVKRAVTAETNCRVRAILTTNAVKGKRLGDYVQGAEALPQGLNNEDIRRFDYALFMKASDIPANCYNTIPAAEKYDIKNFKNLILYSWSRKASDITFTQEAITQILETATKISEMYGHVTHVPIVSAADEKNKIARIATALAFLLHNEVNGKLVVTAAHVQYVEKYLIRIFNLSNCGLNQLAKLATKDEIITDEKYHILKEKITKAVPVMVSTDTFALFIQAFATQGVLRLSNLEATLCVEREDVKSLVRVLSIHQLVTSTAQGYRKTAVFCSFIDKYYRLTD